MVNPSLSQLKSLIPYSRYLFYGPELFNFLGHPRLWSDIISWLVRWKSELPDLPEINLDVEPKETFQEIIGLPISKWRRLIVNDRLWEEGIIQVLFRDGAALQLILAEFSHKQTQPYHNLSKILKEKLDKYY